MAGFEGAYRDALNPLGDINNDEIDGPPAGKLSELRNIQKEDHPSHRLTLCPLQNPELYVIVSSNPYILPTVKR